MNLRGMGRVWVLALTVMALPSGCDSSSNHAPATNAAKRESTAPQQEPTEVIPPRDDVQGVSDLVKAKVKARTLELFDACRAADKTPAISRFVYRGGDVARKWKSALTPEDPDSLDYVTGVCVRIQRSLERGGRPEFTNFSVERESEGLWLVWDVRFEGNGVAIREAFAFLEVGDGYLLGDID